MKRNQFVILIFSAVAFVTGIIPNQANACGPDTNCMIGDRHYRIRMPEGHDGETKVGAIFFMHGYRGSARGIMRNKRIGKAVSDMGLALIAPKAAYDDWALPGSPSEKEPVELEYFDALIEDVSAKFAIDTARIMATGFSAGGMMVWNLACDRGDMFAGYAPISGTFWEPTPTSCSSAPVNLIHTHGKTDRTVPLEGRKILATKQGSVPAVLEMYSRNGSYANPKSFVVGDLECEEKTNPDGKILEFCLHPRGHDMRKEYFIRAWHKFVERGVIVAGG